MGKKRIAEETQEIEPEEVVEAKIKLNNKKQKKQVKNTNKITKDVDFVQFLKEDIRFLIQHRNQQTEEKESKASEVFTKIEGLLYQIAQTKIGGRTIQLVIKCASADIRTQMFEKLLGDKQFSELLQSKYGHYIGVTMVRNMVPQFKNQFFEILLKNAYHFVAQQDASIVLDRFLTREASNQQLKQIRSLFQEHSEKIDNMAMKIIEKGLHNHLLSLQVLKVALPKLVPEEREKVVEYFQTLENLDYLRHKDGVSIFCAILNVTDKKTRKVFLKTVQTYMQQSQEHLHRNSYFYLALEKVIFTYDDTKLINKSILQEILPEWLNNIHVFKIVQSIYSPKLREYVKYDDIPIQNIVSLKDESTRFSELQEYCYSQLLSQLSSSETDILIEPNINQFLSNFIQYTIKCKQSYILESKLEASEFIEKLIQQLLVFKTNQVFNREVEQNGNYWILTQPEAQRIAKCLIQQQQIAQNEYKEQIDSFCTNVFKILLQNLKACLLSKAIYLLIALIENTTYKEEVVQAVQKQKKQIDKLEKTQSLQILCKYI